MFQHIHFNVSHLTALSKNPKSINPPYKYHCPMVNTNQPKATIYFLPIKFFPTILNYVISTKHPDLVFLPQAFSTLHIYLWDEGLWGQLSVHPSEKMVSSAVAVVGGACAHFTTRALCPESPPQSICCGNLDKVLSLSIPQFPQCPQILLSVSSC